VRWEEKLSRSSTSEMSRVLPKNSIGKQNLLNSVTSLGKKGCTREKKNPQHVREIS